MDEYKMPELPDNQRWYVYTSMGTFLHVKLQEKRRWGWRTIADSIEYASGGTWALSKCIERIQNREYLAQLRAEREHKKAQDYNRIPFGPSKN